MKTFDGIAAAADAARTYILNNRDALPPHVQAALDPHTGTGSSPVDLIVRFAEAAYANPESVTGEGAEIAAGAALLAESFGFHGMNEASRGTKIAKVLAGQNVSSAPEPRTELLRTEAEAEAA